MPATLRLGVGHRATSLAGVYALAERLERVPAEAMPEAVGVLSRQVAQTIEGIAGGVYWDIEAESNPTPGGAEGRVWTDKSRPHRIEPTKPHGLLVFEGSGGQTVFVRGGVNHPGSKPVNWGPGVSAQAGAVADVFADHAHRAVSGTGANLAMPQGAL